MNTKLMYLMMALLCFSCHKEFLDRKPNSGIIRPQTIEDLERILDNELAVNITGVLQRMGSDEYFIGDYATWEGLATATQRNAYVWEENLYEGEEDLVDWGKLYTTVFYANSVLDELKIMDAGTEEQRNEVKGRALFIRAWANYDLVNTFAPIYREETASSDLGIPLRTTANVDRIEEISTVQACYDLILSDLQDAAKLLNSERPNPLRTRASKVACYAMLARVYLVMGAYNLALENANKCLDVYSHLTDFNTLDADTDEPFKMNNDDVLFFARQLLDGNFIMTSGVGPNASDFIGIDTALLETYQTADLRRSVFFGEGTDGRVYRKLMFASTTINMYPFTGLATDEVYLIKAECEARLGNTDNARQTLLALLTKRFEKGFELDIDDLQGDALLNRVLEERWKELVWRSIRWTDLKRLNRDGSNILIQRVLNGKAISLEPGSPRYVFPIPDEELIHLQK